jgi:hypothetical protein
MSREEKPDARRSAWREEAAGSFATEMDDRGKVILKELLRGRSDMEIVRMLASDPGLGVAGLRGSGPSRSAIVAAARSSVPSSRTAAEAAIRRRSSVEGRENFPCARIDPRSDGGLEGDGLRSLCRANKSIAVASLIEYPLATPHLIEVRR